MTINLKIKLTCNGDGEAVWAVDTGDGLYEGSKLGEVVTEAVCDHQDRERRKAREEVAA